ncbi:MAG: Bax inhibitor-1/YccA family protein [Magnetococcales bacterium]|nr:Bax inhibitor-1/YccA family protein [Magnetococcales bacterium]
MNENLLKKRPQAQQAEWVIEEGPASAISGTAVDYLKQVYALLAASLLLAVVGGYFGMKTTWAMEHPMLFIAGQFGLMVLAFFVRNTVTLFLFTTLSGFFVGPIIAMYVGRGMSVVVGEALFLTGAVFTVMTFYALTAKRDFSAMGGILFAGMIIILVGGIANLFIQAPALTFAISAMGAFIFSGYLLWETQQLKNNPGVMSPAVAALSLYINILNLFISLLQLLGIFSKDD